MSIYKNMKQNITIDNLNELGEKALEKLFTLTTDLRIPSYTSFAVIMISNPDLKNKMLLSIGQLIEFLDEEQYFVIKKIHPGSHWQWYLSKNEKSIGITPNQEDRYELVDSLWQAVKEILEGDK